MAKTHNRLGYTSAKIRVWLLNTSTGVGMTGLSNTSTGLEIATITDAESAVINYTAAASNIETIATIGTYSAPSAGKCRFKEIDSTNFPGLYELQFADARFAVSNARTLQGSVRGVTNLQPTPFEIQLDTVPGNVQQFGNTDGTFAAGRPEVNASHVGGTLWASAYTAPPSASTISTQVNTDLTIAHGSGAWTTATGFATPVNVTDAVTSIKGADNDTLKTLSDQIDGIDSGGGTGARTVTITVNDGTSVLQNAIVRLTEGINSYTATTNASGVCTFNVDDATYTVSISKSGYSYAGTTLVVDGTETMTYSMTVVAVTPIDAPLCNVLIHIRDQFGNDLADEPVEITFIEFTADAAESPPVLSVPPVQQSDEDGMLQVTLYRDARYKVLYGTHPYTQRIDVTVPDEGSYEVSQ